MARESRRVEFELDPYLTRQVRVNLKLNSTQLEAMSAQGELSVTQ